MLFRSVIDKQVLIKHISEETYNNYKNNPAYKVVEVQLSVGGTSIFPEEMEKAEKENCIYKWLL